MEYGVLLYFDKESNDRIDELRYKVTENNVNKHTVEGGIRPHITLSSFTTDDISILENIKSFFDEINPFKVDFGSLGVFPFEKNVVYLSPTMNIELYNLHKNFYEHISSYQYNFFSYYKPGNWIPHCTIASHLNMNEMLNSITTVREGFKPITAIITGIGIIRGNPAVEIESFRLQ